MSSAADLEALEGRLGYVFGDRALLDRALTHSSSVDGRTDARVIAYERLEFLGDRVLALVVAEMLFDAYPKAPEGELHRRHVALVRKETCVEVARAVDLGAAVRLGHGEALSGGRSKSAILGDVCEAVIGAIYRDGGLESARRFIEAHWRHRFTADPRPLRDAKTVLQEWAQGRGLPTPTYAIAGQTGPQHAPRFTVTVDVGPLPAAQGEGSSRREAEQNAAAAVLSREGIGRSSDAA